MPLNCKLREGYDGKFYTMCFYHNLKHKTSRRCCIPCQGSREGRKITAGLVAWVSVWRAEIWTGPWREVRTWIAGLGVWRLAKHQSAHGELVPPWGGPLWRPFQSRGNHCNTDDSRRDTWVAGWNHSGFQSEDSKVSKDNKAFVQKEAGSESNWSVGGWGGKKPLDQLRHSDRGLRPRWGFGHPQASGSLGRAEQRVVGAEGTLGLDRVVQRWRWRWSEIQSELESERKQSLTLQ